MFWAELENTSRSRACTSNTCFKGDSIKAFLGLGAKISSFYFWLILVLSGRRIRRLKPENYITARRQHPSEAFLHVFWLRLALAEVALASPHQPASDLSPEERKGSSVQEEDI